MFIEKKKPKKEKVTNITPFKYYAVETIVNIMELLVPLVAVGYIGLLIYVMINCRGRL